MEYTRQDIVELLFDAMSPASERYTLVRYADATLGITRNGSPLRVYWPESRTPATLEECIERVQRLASLKSPRDVEVSRIWR